MLTRNATLIYIFFKFNVRNFDELQKEKREAVHYFHNVQSKGKKKGLDVIRTRASRM